MPGLLRLRGPLVVVGHTDATGTDSYNQGLSKRRSASASRYLRSRGVTRDIRALGRGETEPIAGNDSEEGRRLNRRVEVAIYANDALRAEARRQAATP